jgi:hypothetical protein
MNKYIIGIEMLAFNIVTFYMLSSKFDVALIFIYDVIYNVILILIPPLNRSCLSIVNLCGQINYDVTGLFLKRGCYYDASLNAITFKHYHD